MSVLLYINGQLADLEPGQVIAQTKQVNDLNSLDDRQASYTNKFKLPKTANNLKIMQFLTLAGNTSVVPYQKNLCSLYSESGECFVYNGQGVITDGGEDFEIVIYDGVIDLFKAIENTTLANVIEEENDLNHNKDPLTVMQSWQSENNFYRYIVADYNGDLGSDMISPETNQPVPTINIDYLVPSVSVKYLGIKYLRSMNLAIQDRYLRRRLLKPVDDLP